MSLAELGAGFDDAVHGSQQCFRVLLDAMARPGSVHELSAAAIRGLEAPHPTSVGCAAALLTLLDAETNIGLLGSFANEAVRTWLRFHSGVREAANLGTAAFVAASAADVAPGLWSALARGTDEAPQLGATLLIDVPAFDPDASRHALLLRGPGIASQQRLAVAGLRPTFWAERIAMQAFAPRGVDLILVAGTRIAAIPRSTRVAFEEWT